MCALVADTAVGAVPAERAGSAGAIAETSNEIGNALGIALLGSLAVLAIRWIPASAAAVASDTARPGPAPVTVPDRCGR